MKTPLLYVFAAILALAVSYPTTYDDFDAETSFNDPEYLRNAIGCYLDTHPCDTPVALFKAYATDIIQTACSTCTPAQRKIFKIFYQKSKETYPDLVDVFFMKYDPQRIFFSTFVNAISEA